MCTIHTNAGARVFSHKYTHTHTRVWSPGARVVEKQQHRAPVSLSLLLLSIKTSRRVGIAERQNTVFFSLSTRLYVGFFPLTNRVHRSYDLKTK